MIAQSAQRYCDFAEVAPIIAAVPGYLMEGQEHFLFEHVSRLPLNGRK